MKKESNTTESNEPSYEQLQDRVETLESTVDELTTGETVEDERGRTWSLGSLLNLGLTRREALYVLGALGSGVTFAGAFRKAIGLAAANPDEVDVGTPDEPADAYLSNVYGPHGDIDFQDPVSIETVNNDYHFAGAFDGSDADARLDNALSAASAGDTIFAENATYSADRSIGSQVKIVGTGSLTGQGSRIDAIWTLGTTVQVEGFDEAAGAIQVNSDQCRISNLNGGFDITVSGDSCIITECNSPSVTFESGTSQGIIDSCTGNVSVTDNGSNILGDY